MKTAITVSYDEETGDTATTLAEGFRQSNDLLLLDVIGDALELLLPIYEQARARYYASFKPVGGGH